MNARAGDLLMHVACLFLIIALSTGCGSSNDGGAEETVDASTGLDTGTIVALDGGSSGTVDASVDSEVAVDSNEDSVTHTGSGADAGAPVVLYDQCTTPGDEDLLYPPYPPIPQDCVQDFWQCPYEPDYGTVSPTAATKPAGTTGAAGPAGHAPKTARARTAPAPALRPASRPVTWCSPTARP